MNREDNAPLVYSIVIPVYNSSKTLPTLLQEIKQVMHSLRGRYEVIFVDDCSPDDSWTILKQLQPTDDNIKILRLANNVGQWMATLAGIRYSSGDLIITIDDDLEYDTADIMVLINVFNERTDYMIYGIPAEKKIKIYRTVCFLK